MAARALRYEWFEEIATDFDYPYIATAHHADDDLETMLINLSRGSGLKGLCGIPPINGKVVRPLLPFTREQIHDFAKEEGITWREDSSNLSTQYLRNALRHEVLPVFLRYFPSLQTGSYRSRSHLAGAGRLVDDYMRLVSQKVESTHEGTLQIDLNELKAFRHTDEILYQLLEPYGFTAWKDVYGLLTAQSGKQVHSASHILLKDRNRLILTPAGEEGTSQPITISSLEELADISWLEYSMVDRLDETGPEMAYLAYEKLNFPLEIRPWREGDYFYPFGMTGKKKLSKFFKDEKLSLHAKKMIRLLCSGGQVVWIIGLRTDDRFKVEDGCTMLKLTFLKQTT
jgi:tRNA(Ile)-lysidine synthase